MKKFLSLLLSLCLLTGSVPAAPFAVSARAEETAEEMSEEETAEEADMEEAEEAEAPAEEEPAEEKEEVSEEAEEPETEEVPEVTEEPETEEVPEEAEEPETEEVSEVTEEPAAEEVPEEAEETVTEEVSESSEEPEAEEDSETAEEPVTEEASEVTEEPETEVVPGTTEEIITEVISETAETAEEESAEEELSVPGYVLLKEGTWLFADSMLTEPAGYLEADSLAYAEERDEENGSLRILYGYSGEAAEGYAEEACAQASEKDDDGTIEKNGIVLTEAAFRPYALPEETEAKSTEELARELFESSDTDSIVWQGGVIFSGVLDEDEYAQKTLSIYGDASWLTAYIECADSMLTVGKKTEWTLRADNGSGEYYYEFTFFYQNYDTDFTKAFNSITGTTKLTGGSEQKITYTPKLEGKYFINVKAADLSTGGYVYYQSPIYETDKSTLESEDVEKKAEEIVAEVASSGTDYQKARALHNWLINHADYYQTSKDTDGTAAAYRYLPDGVLLYGLGVCQSYALAYQILCEKAGISCLYVTGTAKSGTTMVYHAWNIIEIGGERFHVDCTWDDPVGGSLRYDYFMVSDAVMAEDHNWNYSNTASESRKDPVMPDADCSVITELADLAALNSGEPSFTLYYPTDEDETTAYDTVFEWVESVQDALSIASFTLSRGTEADGGWIYTWDCVYDGDALKSNIITARTSFNAKNEEQWVNLYASAKGGAALSYAVTAEEDNDGIENSLQVTDNGVVKVPAGWVGEADITITAAASGIYRQTSTTVHLTANRIDPELKTEVKSLELSADPKARSFALGASSKAGELDYSCSLTLKGLVTVSADGKATVKADSIGSGTIVVISPETGIYKRATLEIPVTVKKGANVISVTKTTVNAHTYDQTFSLGASCGGGAKLTYVSSDPDFAVNSKGNVTVKSGTVGTGIITITSSAVTAYTKTVRKVTVYARPNANTITASNISRAESASAVTVSLNASCKGGAKLTYSSSSKDFAVSSGGKVTIAKNAIGRATITITAAAKGIYAKTIKTVTVTVRPKKTVIGSAVNLSGLNLRVRWTAGNTKLTGYQVQVSETSGFASGTYKTVNVSGASSVQTVVSGLTKGKTYYVRVRSYITADGSRICSAWSNVLSCAVTK